MPTWPAANVGSGWDQTSSVTAGLSEIEFALKHFYLPGMEEQKNNARVLLANLERNEKDVSGDYAFVPILLGRNWGIGMRANRSPLPDAGYQRGARTQIPMKYAFGQLIVTLHAMTATRNSQGSYDTVLDVETEGLMEDLPKDINRQLFLDGTGRIGQQTGAVAGNVITLGNTTILAPLNAAERAKYFEVGMRIDTITNATGAVVNAGLVVSSVNEAADTVTFTTAPSSATTDFLVISGNYNLEVGGLLALVSATGTYQGINRATAGNERWQANVISGTGDITEDLLQQVDTACEKASGMTPNMIIGSFAARDKYASILQQGRRFVNTLEYKGGFKGPEFNGRALVPDPECPLGHLYFLNTKYISLYQQAGLQFMDQDGAVLSRKSGYAAYEATLYWFFEMGARRCNVHGRLSGFNQ